MSCDCQKYSTISVKVAPADTGIPTGLTAPVAGDYLVLVEFNGTYQRLVLTLTLHQAIILPNVVNGDYNHELQIFKPDNTLLGDTCYMLRVRSITGPGNGLPPTPSAYTRGCFVQVMIKTSPNAAVKWPLCNGTEIPMEYPVGDSLQIPHLIGLYVKFPFVMDNSIVETPDWDSATGTWTAAGAFNDGSVITIQYEEPV